MNINTKNAAIQIDKHEIESIVEKLRNISEELKDMFVERENVIDNSIKALITGQTVLLIGPPGTAKSALTNELCKRIDKGQYFSWLLNRTSDPAEILGPFSIKEMEKDKFLRVTTNKLPEAEIVFLDEIFKCNEPTLNILLPIINEKLFYNDGEAIDVPLVTLFAASNEFPEEDSLMALYDRMIFRMYVDYIGDVQNKLKMFKSFLKRDSERTVTTVSLIELRKLRSMLDCVVIEDNILKEYIALINALLREGIVISDRRQNECLRVLKANAIIHKRWIVDETDFKCLKDVLWNDIDDIEVIEEILKESSLTSYEKEYSIIKKRFTEIVSTTESITDARMLIEIKGSIEHIYDKTKRILKEKDLMQEKTSAKFISIENEISEYIEQLTNQIGDEDDMFF